MVNSAQPAAYSDTDELRVCPVAGPRLGVTPVGSCGEGGLAQACLTTRCTGVMGRGGGVSAPHCEVVGGCPESSLGSLGPV